MSGFTSDDFGVPIRVFIDGIGLTLNENHIVNQIIYLDDKHQWRSLLDKKIEELETKVQISVPKTK